MRKVNNTLRNNSPTTKPAAAKQGANLPAVIAPPHVGSDPVAGPLEPMLRLDQVLALLACSRSTLYKRIDDGQFPAPHKNGRIAIWPTASIRQWMADPSNFNNYVAAKTAAPRGIGRSAVFASSVDRMIVMERALEVLVLTILHNQYKQFCKVNKPSQYDVKAAAAVQARLAELEAGAMGNMPILKRWRPSART